MTVLAFDLGGTRLKTAAFDGATPDAVDARDVSGSIDDVLAALEAAGREALGGRVPTAVGLAVPGLVHDGVVVSLPGKHPGIEGCDLVGFLTRAFGARAVVLNDAIAYGIGEATVGAGRGCARAVVVTLGTGVGVTVIEHGRPLGSGPLGGGLMGGFIPIADEPGGFRDTNGGTGTIEALCRADRLVYECAGVHTSVHEVYAAHARGDEAARAGVARYRRNLARALAALASAHAPDVIVLGGGPVAPGNPILPGLADEVNAQLFGTYRVGVAAAGLGDAAALAGLGRVLVEEP